MIYTIAANILLICFFFCLALAAAIFSKPVAERLTVSFNLNQSLKNFNLIIFAGLFGTMLILLSALVKADYDLAYSLKFISPDLPIYYRISGLWAGAEGSLLCWAFATSFAAILFQTSRFYQSLSESTALYFWGFFYLVLGFFLFLLSTFSQPFILNTEGIPLTNPAGLNPLLRHPAMILHPPLIFLGYAMLAIPACLGFARLVSGPGINSETPALRAFLITAWVLVGAGIILGMWWAYTESSWGGYWTWDPVENTSLLPWLALTAALHSNHLEAKRGKLYGLNSFLCILPLIATLFATFIVRSGILASKHSYGLGNWSLSLLLFMAILTVLASLAFWFCPRRNTLAPPFSKEGLILFQIFLLYGLGLVILIGTMWPWITGTFSAQSLALASTFFTNSCLPLVLLLLFCALAMPSISWDGQDFNPKIFTLSLLTVIAFIALLYISGFQKSAPNILAGFSLAFLVSIISSTLFSKKKSLPRPHPRPLSQFSSIFGHAGFALLLFGIAMSSGYKEEWQIVLTPDQTAKFDQREVHYLKLEFGRKTYAFAQLSINIKDDTNKDANHFTTLEQRAYNDKQVFTKTSFLHGLKDNLGFSLLQLHEDRSALIKIVNSPFVNAIWLGGLLMCLAIIPACLPTGSRRKEL